jgi:hypothetical protein
MSHLNRALSGCRCLYSLDTWVAKGPRNILTELVLGAGHKRPRRRRELRGFGGHKGRKFGRGPKNNADITGGRRHLFDPAKGHFRMALHPL